MLPHMEIRLAEELACKPTQISAAIALLDAGSPVPFVARYRRDLTGGLDETQLRTLQESLFGLRELEQRRTAILSAAQAQGAISDALGEALRDASTRQRLEDLHLACRPRRRGRVQSALEAGLGELAEALRADPTRDPQESARPYVQAKPAVVQSPEETEATPLLSTVDTLGQPPPEPVEPSPEATQEASEPTPRDLAEAPAPVEEPVAAVLAESTPPEEHSATPEEVTEVAAESAEASVLAESLPEPAGAETPPAKRPKARAKPALPAGLYDVAAVLEGARQILCERLAEDADLIGLLRTHMQAHAQVVSSVVKGKEKAAEKFRDYFAYAEALSEVPAQRALALFRGRKEEFLRVDVKLPEEIEADPVERSWFEQAIATHAGIEDQGRPADAWLQEIVRMTWRGRLRQFVQQQVLDELRTRAETEAIATAAAKLRDLLLAPAAGPHTVVGLDPGLRTGVRVAVIDPAGKVLETTTIFPHAPRNETEGSLQTLADLAKRHDVRLVGIGAGGGTRETDRLLAQLHKAHPELGLARILLPEPASTLYTKSTHAAADYPEVDAALRGAVWIARRLQDPLAELVKLEPRSIGLGHYQQDVPKGRLKRALDAAVEDCVNSVGVDPNQASVLLLSRVSGLNREVAEALVAWRTAQGPFLNRAALLAVPAMTPERYEQCAAFLRISGGDDPLDKTTVHPRSYALVARIVQDLQAGSTELAAAGPAAIESILGNDALLRNVDPTRYADDHFTVGGVRAVLRQLAHPRSDPRGEFRTAAFNDGVTELTDLQPGMLLEGVVTSVAEFGLFVDVGVQQNGLVHISALSHNYVKNPRAVARPGDVVKVKVLEVDEKRRRLSLSLRTGTPPAPAARPERQARPERPRQPGSEQARPDQARPGQGRPRGDRPERSGATDRPSRGPGSGSRPARPSQTQQAPQARREDPPGPMAEALRALLLARKGG